jgi:hypothetical protein
VNWVLEMYPSPGASRYIDTDDRQSEIADDLVRKKSEDSRRARVPRRKVA